MDTLDTRRVVIVDDHPLLAKGLQAELESRGAEVDLIEPCGELEGVADAIIDRDPHCAVIDLGLPLAGGGQALVAALVAGGLRVAVLTGESERWQWAQAIHAGAEVVVSKAEAMSDIVDALAQVAAGHPARPVDRVQLAADYERLAAERRDRLEVFQQLSRREREILGGLMAGLGVQQMTERHVVSVQTVRTQVKSILRKLSCSSQLEAVALANAAGWVPPDQDDPGRHT